MALAQSLSFQDFLKAYQEKSARALEASQNFSRAKNQLERDTDMWQGRLTATPQVEFLERKFNSAPEDNVSFRAQDVSINFEQKAPTGTNLILSGQKFIETQSPLVSSVDLRYSARVTQDLFRNSFGRTQRSQMRKAQTEFQVAQMQLRQSFVESCGEAFKLYTETYIQQEIVKHLQAQMKDAQQALQIARQLHKNRLINDIDKLSSESDFLNTQLQTQQAELRLENNRRQIQAYLDSSLPPKFKLSDPRVFLTRYRGVPKDQPTLAELIATSRLKGQEFDVERSRTDRWTDVQLGLEAGRTEGRFGFSGPLLEYNDAFLRATVTVGLDIINKTEDSDLKNSIRLQNSLAKQKQITHKTQQSTVESLSALNKLLHLQVNSSEKQVSILERKAKAAFDQMKRARLDFENYLLHRNAYLERKVNDLNLKKDYWLNQFNLQKEFAHQTPEFCETTS